MYFRQEAAAAAVPDVTEDEVTEILAAAGIATDKDGTSDELIARMMQLEFDREHNKMLQKEQEKLNGTNKGKSCNNLAVFKIFSCLHPKTCHLNVGPTMLKLPGYGPTERSHLVAILE